LASAGFALVFGFVFMFLLKCCAGVVIWGAIALYLTACAVLGFVCYRESSNMTSSESGSNILSNKKDGLMAIAITLWVVGAISLLVILCLIKRIKLAVAIMKTASDFTRSVWEVLLVPLVMFLLAGAVFTFWMFVTLYLYSSGEVTRRGETPFGHVAW
jgi:choline transporter-like protein 2/4/5